MIFLANNSEKENMTDKVFTNHRVSLRGRKGLRTSEKFVLASEVLSLHMKNSWLAMTLLAILLVLSELKMKFVSFRYGKKPWASKSQAAIAENGAQAFVLMCLKTYCISLVAFPAAPSGLLPGF